jgi:hypothetical protein
MNQLYPKLMIKKVVASQKREPLEMKQWQQLETKQLKAYLIIINKVVVLLLEMKQLYPKIIIITVHSCGDHFSLGEIFTCGGKVCH